MSQEKILFEKCIARVNAYLKVIGAQLIPENRRKSFIVRLRTRWFLCFILIWSISDVFAEIAWIINAVTVGTSLVDLTYVAPCSTQCMLAFVKVYYFLGNEDHVIDLIDSLSTLLSITAASKARKVERELQKRVKFLNRVTVAQFWINIIALAGFGLLPFVILVLNYFSTGKIVLTLPFLVLYPFDVYDIKFWPFIYLRQMCSGVIIVFIVFGVDALYYTCCTFIQIQFYSLKYEFENIAIPKFKGILKYERETKTFLAYFSILVQRHQELIRCVNLMENIYTKSTLFNVVTSSFLICLTGFNVTAIDYLPMMVPFIAFLSLVLVQIFLFCYFGDILMRSSVEVSDAVYKSQWYNMNFKVMKSFYIVLLRAQKPCKMTAYGFSDINLRTFTRILSTAWSYFALLSSVNRN